MLKKISNFAGGNKLLIHNFDIRAGSTIIVDGRVAELESVCVLRRRSVLDVHDRGTRRKAAKICDTKVIFAIIIE